MAKFGNLDGTLRSDFQIGPEDGTGFRRNALGELELYDPVAGLATLASLMGGGDLSDILTSRQRGEVLVSRQTGDVVVRR